MGHRSGRTGDPTPSRRRVAGPRSARRSRRGGAIGAGPGRRRNGPQGAREIIVISLHAGHLTMGGVSGYTGPAPPPPRRGCRGIGLEGLVEDVDVQREPPRVRRLVRVGLSRVPRTGGGCLPGVRASVFGSPASQGVHARPGGVPADVRAPVVGLWPLRVSTHGRRLPPGVRAPVPGRPTDGEIGVENEDVRVDVSMVSGRGDPCEVTGAARQHAAKGQRPRMPGAPTANMYASARPERTVVAPTGPPLSAAGQDRLWPCPGAATPVGSLARPHRSATRSQRLDRVTSSGGRLRSDAARAGEPREVFSVASASRVLRDPRSARTQGRRRPRRAGAGVSTWQTALEAKEGVVPAGTPSPSAHAFGVLPIVGATGRFKDLPGSTSKLPSKEIAPRR